MAIVAKWKRALEDFEVQQSALAATLEKIFSELAQSVNG